MSLALLVGPANAGKVASLLDRYVAALDHEPVLVVPNRGEIERIERDLLTRVGGILGGSIGTFDDLVGRLAPESGGRALLSRLQRALLIRSVISGTELGRLRVSARFDGFADALGDAIRELEAALVEPEEVGGELGRLYAAYVDRLEELGASDPERRAAAAAERLGRDLSAWGRSPVFLYGFEDFTGSQWGLLEALAGRVDVTVSLPYEPGRTAFAALERTARDLAALAGEAIEELPAQSWYDASALAHVERRLFTDSGPPGPPLDGAIRFLEAAGTRSCLELVGDEILGLLRSGTQAEAIAVVVPVVERYRASLETVFGSFGIPFSVEAPIRLRRTPFGRALLGLLRFAWLDGSRKDLFAFVRSPYSGIPRFRADFLEGRLRGRAVSTASRVEEETTRLLGRPIDPLERLRAVETPAAAVGDLARSMLRAAWGVEHPPVEEAVELDLRCEEAVREALDEIEGWASLGGSVERETIVDALGEVTAGAPRRASGRVAVLDLLRVRTRRFQEVFVLGLEDGVLPRRPPERPFVGDDLRKTLDEGKGRRLPVSDDLARDRYLFYTACTRPWRRLVLAREASTDEGRPIEPSPFYDEVRSLFDPVEVGHATRRRRLSQLAWELHRAPTERERLRSVAALASESSTTARALAVAEGWTRQIERALAAFSRPTRLVNPIVLRELRAVGRFSVTEVEQFGDCSSMWLFEKVVTPRAIDGEVDARLRGAVAHQTLYRFYAGLPKRLGSDMVEPERLDEALEFLAECLREAIAGQVRLEASEIELLELEAGLGRDLEHFVRREAELRLPLVPRRFEVSFGSNRAAPELQRGLDLGGFTLSGKIDRIDVDPFSARGIVQDYKSGEAFSASKIAADRRLQIPLYVLALRDLVGIEPLGGLYRSLSGEREARGIVRDDARADVPGLPARDYLDEDRFWEQVDRAADHARGAVERIRAGQVRHDPRWSDGCPSWCKLWSMCRVERA